MIQILYSLHLSLQLHDNLQNPEILQDSPTIALYIILLQIKTKKIINIGAFCVQCTVKTIVFSMR